MICSRTPVRIEIGGGATDVEPYCSDHGGHVINVTINKYFRSILNKREDKSLNIYSNESFFSTVYEKIDKNYISEKSKNLIEAILFYMKPDFGIDIYIHGEAPERAGLGASASLSTSLIGGITKLKEKNIDKELIAEQAYDVEDTVLHNVGGRQDQYASVYGGFNEITFKGGSNVIVNKIKFNHSFEKLIQENLILYYTGTPHISGNLVSKQVKSYMEKKEASTKYLDQLKEISIKKRDALISEDFETFGGLLTEDWKIKSKFNPELTTAFMKKLNNIVMNNGGLGGRVCGAGGGGCFIWLVKPDSKEKILELLKKEKGYNIGYEFTSKGLEISNI